MRAVGQSQQHCGEWSAYAAVVRSPVPRLHIGVRTGGGVLTRLDLIGAHVPLKRATSQTARQAVEALARYFDDPCAEIAVPMSPRGTAFQHRVWHALRALPVGCAWTYGQLAAALFTSPRAVGAACRANPVPILTPCHRIVAAAGVGGYAGDAEGPRVELKQWLLAHERSHVPCSAR